MVLGFSQEISIERWWRLWMWWYGQKCYGWKKKDNQREEAEVQNGSGGHSQVCLS